MVSAPETCDDQKEFMFVVVKDKYMFILAARCTNMR